MSSLTSSIHPTYGFHPTLTVAFTLKDASECSLHILLALPPAVFVDPYELANHNADYSFQHVGTSNLEAPVAAVGPEYSYALLNITEHAVSKGSTQIPLHLRYGDVGFQEYQAVDMPSPEGFISCQTYPNIPKSDILSRMPTEFSNLFPSMVPISSRGDPFRFNVPVGQRDDLFAVEIGTALTILLCFGYLVHVSLKTATRLRDKTPSKRL